MSYKELEIYKLSFQLFLEVHELTQLLPKQEGFELGSQIRRSADSVVTNIVEGYGRSMYKLELIRFITYSKASNDETIVHLKKLHHLYPSLRKQTLDLTSRYEELGIKIYRFEQYILNNWKK